MKLTEQKLREIIQSEIKSLNESLITEAKGKLKDLAKDLVELDK